MKSLSTHITESFRLNEAAKDEQRIEGIMRKAGGSPSKEAQFAKNMAKSITGLTKIEARWQAAVSIAGPDSPITKEFAIAAQAMGSKLVDLESGSKAETKVIPRKRVANDFHMTENNMSPVLDLFIEDNGKATSNCNQWKYNFTDIIREKIRKKYAKDGNIRTSGDVGVTSGAPLLFWSGDNKKFYTFGHAYRYDNTAIGGGGGMYGLNYFIEHEVSSTTLKPNKVKITPIEADILRRYNIETYRGGSFSFEQANQYLEKALGLRNNFMIDSAIGDQNRNNEIAFRDFITKRDK